MRKIGHKVTHYYKKKRRKNHIFSVFITFLLIPLVFRKKKPTFAEKYAHMTTKTMTYWCITLLMMLLPKSLHAQIWDSPLRLAVKSNIVYDLALSPNIGVEVGVGKNLSLAASGTYGWLEGWPWHDNIRVITADASLHYWLGNADDVMHRGFHLGPYAAIYRYDFLFGSKGQEAKANWGAGLSLGYSLPVSPSLSFDFGLGLGYIGGKYQEYEPADDDSGHHIWMADKKRNYVGPTKVEVSLVWHLFGPKQSAKKGGQP